VRRQPARRTVDGLRGLLGFGLWCRRKIEMSPGVQSRDDIPVWPRSASLPASRSGVEQRNLIASPDRDLRYYCRRLVKRKRALLGSNPPRNSRLETHSDGWEPIGTGRLPPPGVAKPPSSQAIGVDLPIPEKPTLPRDTVRAGLAGGISVKWNTKAAVAISTVRIAASGRSRGSTVAWRPPL
jgi:hypothetical protein